MLDPSILVGAGAPTPLQGAARGPTTGTAAVTGVDHGNAERRLSALAAALELSTVMDRSDALEAAAIGLAGSLADYLSAQRVFLFWRNGDTDPFRLIAEVADNPGRTEELQTTGSWQRFATAAAEEVSARGELTSWPPRNARDRPALLAVAQLAAALAADGIVAIGLPGPARSDAGVIIVADPQRRAAEYFLPLLAPLASSRLDAIGRLAPNRWELYFRQFSRAIRHPRRKHVFGVSVIVVMLMLLPLHYRVRGEVEIQPVEHRFIAVPFDGPLESAHVRPGDVVQPGQLVATINPREIEYELAGVRTELERADQKRKAMMAEHDSAGGQIAALESDRLRIQSELLEYRRENLEIRSPIRGVVVSDDLKQSEGTPMSRGDTIFEIAPLGKMIVEIAVDEVDFLHVRPGMPVSFYVHALPGRPLAGKIQRVHPRATLRDHDNVFIAELQIDDPENLLRPGMRGRAEIISDRHPLAWNLFHKSYHALRGLVGW